MQDNEADFTLTFRRLCEAVMSPEREGSLRQLFKDAGANDKWATNWRVRLSLETKVPNERVKLMHQVNPALYLVTIVLSKPSKLPWTRGLRSLREALGSSLLSL